MSIPWWVFPGNKVVCVEVETRIFLKRPVASPEKESV